MYLGRVTKEEAIRQMTAHIHKQGGAYHDWYVGISANTLIRLFNEHKVATQSEWWVYCTVQDAVAARSLEDDLRSLGCDGGSDGGDTSTRQVYAYLKTERTKP